MLQLFVDSCGLFPDTFHDSFIASGKIARFVEKRRMSVNPKIISMEGFIWMA